MRIRLGVKPEQIWGELRDYVLRKMGRAERETAQQMAADAAEAVELICSEGVGKAMSRFNRKVAPRRKIRSRDLSLPQESKESREIWKSVSTI